MRKNKAFKQTQGCQNWTYLSSKCKLKSFFVFEDYQRGSTASQTFNIYRQKSAILLKCKRKNSKINNNFLTTMSHLEREQLILLYYNTRGKMQVIRNLLCYLGIPFVELHLELIQAGLEIPDDQTLSKLKSQPVDRTKLPLLVHGTEYIYGTFSINLHVCTLARRLDLFGRTDSQMREVQKTLELLLQTQMKSQTFILEFAQKCLNKSDREVNHSLLLSFESFMNSFTFVREACLKLEERQNRSFVFESLTIVDFYFMESCFYILGVWGSIDGDNSRSLEVFCNPIVSSSAGRPSNTRFLETMRQFYRRMTEMPYYRNSQHFLESFPVVNSLMSEQRTAGLRRVWMGDVKYML